MSTKETNFRRILTCIIYILFEVIVQFYALVVDVDNTYIFFTWVSKSTDF